MSPPKIWLKHYYGWWKPTLSYSFNIVKNWFKKTCSVFLFLHTNTRLKFLEKPKILNKLFIEVCILTCTNFSRTFLVSRDHVQVISSSSPLSESACSFSSIDPQLHLQFRCVVCFFKLYVNGYLTWFKNENVDVFRCNPLDYYIKTKVWTVFKLVLFAEILTKMT